MTIRRVLVFFPQCPLPARSGAHRRCLEFLEGLRDLGCDVRICSTDGMDDGRWTDEGRLGLEAMGVQVGGIWKGCTRWEHHWQRALGRLHRPRHPLEDPSWTPRSLSRMVRDEIRDFRPDAVIHNYVLWWALSRTYRREGVPAAIEMHDLVTLNAALRKRLSDRWAATGGVPLEGDASLMPGFFDDPALRADPLEFACLGRFPVISCISRAEQDQVDKNCRKSRSVLVPMTREAASSTPSLEGPAILPIGPNPFNLQGLHVLARSVLPLVRERAPEFSIRVTGAIPEGAPRVAGLEYVGYVSDLRAEFARSSFLASPVFGGTGEQVKVLEAMAAGLPAVVLEGPFQENAVRHGVDGFCVTDAAAFAEACVRLWTDPPLRRKFGEAGLDRVRRERSEASRREALGALLGILEDARP